MLDQGGSGRNYTRLTISAYLALGLTKLSNDGLTNRRYLSNDFSGEYSLIVEGGRTGQGHLRRFDHVQQRHA